MRLPDNSQRLNIYGQTGSGKTVAGLWHLEKRDWNKRRWIIFDFKGDKTIRKIPRLEEIRPDHIPKAKGLYVVRPLPGDLDEVQKMLWEIWKQENIGLYIDEAYMMGRTNKAWDGILTQGRSKNISVISCSQRPSWLSPFQMSEADYHQVMHIQNPADVDRLQQWIPGLRPTKRDYHSQYYEVPTGELTHCLPVPPEDVILERYGDKMPRRMHLFRGITSNAAKSSRDLKRA